MKLRPPVARADHLRRHRLSSRIRHRKGFPSNLRRRFITSRRFASIHRQRLARQYSLPTMDSHSFT